MIVGLAAAAEKDGEATIVEGSKVAEYLTETGYNYNFKTSNNIHVDELYDVNKDIVTGFYEYVSPEGRNIRVDYTAGAGIGFNPRSTPDVIPDEIIKSIELNLKNPPEPKA